MTTDCQQRYKRYSRNCHCWGHNLGPFQGSSFWPHIIVLSTSHTWKLFLESSFPLHHTFNCSLSPVHSASWTFSTIQCLPSTDVPLVQAILPALPWMGTITTPLYHLQWSLKTEPPYAYKPSLPWCTTILIKKVRSSLRCRGPCTGCLPAPLCLTFLLLSHSHNDLLGFWKAPSFSLGKLT